MGLDAFVRCGCVRDGKAKPHPYPKKFVFDGHGEPIPKGDISHEEWEAHDRWLAASCEHGGYLAAERLGNITLAKHVRDFLRGLQGEPAPRFPILLKKVVYDGTHTGDPARRNADAAGRTKYRSAFHRYPLSCGEGILHEYETTV
jgi:hypothetical protein